MNQDFKKGKIMIVRHVSKLCLVTVLVAFGTGFGLDKAIAAPRGPTDMEEGVQVLTRGPVHEAFAETVTFDPEPGIVVTRLPRDIIEEVPPEQKPEGANVAWIPGYWAWDDERSDFIWVSGIWRALPPGRQWVPGYWGPSGQGAQWTSGYWADATVSEIEYLPEPPETVEAGPNIAAPSADHLWIPGCWVRNLGRYAWRPGYWAPVQPDWVWVPDHYLWASRGYVFVDGYWDYSLGRRGVMFAPAYFDASVYRRRGFYYSPSTVIDLSVFTDHLFLRPRYGHYYFGDYYAASYYDTGFYPWFSFQSNRYGYDPIYAHYRWQHRRDRDWDRRIETDFRRRRDHEEARPPRTLEAMKQLGSRGEKSKDKSLVVATPLDQLTKSKDRTGRFQPLDKEERAKLAKHGQEVQKTREERRKLEAKAADASAKKQLQESQPAKIKLPKAADAAAQKQFQEFQPARIKLPRSPFVAKPADQLGKEYAAPKTYSAPKPDLTVEPKPRRAARRSGGESNDTPRGESTDKPKGESQGKPKN